MNGSDVSGSSGVMPQIAQGLEWLGRMLEPVGQWLAGNWPVLSLMLAVYLGVIATRSFWSKVWRILQDILFTNWQLALLGTTGLVLSLASGWTTWDGMRNFTGEPILSLMITFGIQGVMLIVAWLIGETFATGMNRRSGGRAKQGVGGLWLPVGGAVVALAVMSGLTYALFARDQLPFSAEQMLFAGVALAIVALVGFLQADLLQPYLQSGRIIVRNAVLWVMFLACMATSVFFSFDSLFSAIFPQEERARAAEIRAVNQVAGVVADIGGLAETRRLEAAEGLFQQDSWRAYEHQLDLAAGLARKAPAEIRGQLQKELEEQKERVASLEETRANAEAQQAGLQVRKQQLNEDLSRLSGERPQVASATIEQQQVVAEIIRRLDEQRTKVLAEEKGVEGTGKVGRGQVWRAEKAAEERVRSELQVAEERLKAPKTRVAEIDRRIASVKAELAQIDGDLAKLKGAAETAQQMIAVAQGGTPTETAERFDPSVGVAALDRDRQSFRQEPKQQTLAAIQTQCGALVTASLKVESLREEAAAIDCNPRAAIEAAGVVFALNDGLVAYRQNCAGGDRLPVAGGTDGLLQFGRKCLQDSGLTSTDSAKMGAALSAIDLNRDDRAHRFVVTWNAFQDGNRLAYLALAIAIAIDALVFMSGLFGANAVRSPLQDVPGDRPRSAQQLEEVVLVQLRPHVFENAQAVINAMQPITPIDGHTQEVMLSGLDVETRRTVSRVLNAGANIGAVFQDPQDRGRYLIRPELFEFLSLAAHKDFDGRPELKERAEEIRRTRELSRIVSVALQPHVGDHAAIVLARLDPIDERERKSWLSFSKETLTGFTSQLLLKNAPPLEHSIIKRVLNAASVLGGVQVDNRSGEADRFYVHKDLYKTLAMIAAANPPTYQWEAEAHRALKRLGPPAPTGPDTVEGGDLTPDQGSIGKPTATKLLNGPGDPAAKPAQSRHHEAQSANGIGASRSATLDDVMGFEDRLLEALGFERLVDVRARLQTSGVVKAAINAWRALDEQCAKNDRLSRLVNTFTYEKREAYSEAYSLERSRIGRQQELLDALDAVESRLTTLLPVLMLFPEIGLVSNLTSELERAISLDADPKPAEFALLERLRTVSDLLSDLDLSEPQSWAEVSAVLNAPDSDLGDDDAGRREPFDGEGDGPGPGDDVPNYLRSPRKSDGGRNA